MHSKGNKKILLKFSEDIMLRKLLIEKGENTKTNNFKALNIEKIILKIVKLKVRLMVAPLMEVNYLL